MYANFIIKTVWNRQGSIPYLYIDTKGVRLKVKHYITFGLCIFEMNMKLKIKVSSNSGYISKFCSTECPIILVHMYVYYDNWEMLWDIQYYSLFFIPKHVIQNQIFKNIMS